MVTEIEHLDVDVSVSTNPSLRNTGILEGFDPQAVDSIQLLGLHKLKSLNFDGPDFHYMMASLPALRKLSIGQHTSLESIQERRLATETRLQHFSITSDNRILNPRSPQHEHFSRFMTYLPSLEKVEIFLCDSSIDDWYDVNYLGNHIDGITFGSFDALITALEPCRKQVQEMIIDVLNYQVAYQWMQCIDYCGPVLDLHQFSSLRHLEIPYLGLIGSKRIPGILHTKSITDVLPPSLESLKILFPRTDIYQWLKPLTNDVSKLPNLKEINLYCKKGVSDRFVEFAVMLQPNAVDEDLERRGIEVWLSRDNSHLPELDQYDMSSIWLLVWQVSGADGTVIDRVSFPEKGNLAADTGSSAVVDSIGSRYSRIQTCIDGRTWRHDFAQVDPVVWH